MNLHSIAVELSFHSRWHFRRPNPLFHANDVCSSRRPVCRLNSIRHLSAAMVVDSFVDNVVLHCENGGERRMVSCENSLVSAESHACQYTYTSFGLISFSLFRFAAPVARLRANNRARTYANAAVIGLTIPQKTVVSSARSP